MNPFKHQASQGYKIALVNVPRICPPTSFVEDSKLFVGCTEPPSVATVRRWMRAGKVDTVNLCGRTYIQLHSTLLRYKLAY